MHTPPDTPAASPRDAVLVTGFDPFGGDRLNPSWEVAQALHGRDIGGHRVVAGQLPTEFGRAAVGDAAFVLNLRRGRSPTLATADKVLKHIERLEAEEENRHKNRRKG